MTFALALAAFFYFSTRFEKTNEKDTTNELFFVCVCVCVVVSN